MAMCLREKTEMPREKPKGQLALTPFTTYFSRQAIPRHVPPGLKVFIEVPKEPG